MHDGLKYQIIRMEKYRTDIQIARQEAIIATLEWEFRTTNMFLERERWFIIQEELGKAYMELMEYYTTDSNKKRAKLCTKLNTSTN